MQHLKKWLKNKENLQQINNQKDMCLIIYKKSNVSFLSKYDYIEKALLSGLRVNTDGVGIAIKDSMDGSILVKRSLEIKHAHEIMKFIRDSSRDAMADEIVIHLRMSTGGDITENNCHPIPMVETNKRQTEEIYKSFDFPVMFHNGVLSFAPSEGYSDTHKLIDHLYKDNNFDKDKFIKNIMYQTLIIEKLQNEIQHNRFLIMIPGIEASSSAIMLGEWRCKEDIWFAGFPLPMTNTPDYQKYSKKNNIMVVNGFRKEKETYKPFTVTINPAIFSAVIPKNILNEIKKEIIETENKTINFNKLKKGDILYENNNEIESEYNFYIIEEIRYESTLCKNIKNEYYRTLFKTGANKDCHMHVDFTKAEEKTIRKYIKKNNGRENIIQLIAAAKEQKNNSIKIFNKTIKYYNAAYILFFLIDKQRKDDNHFNYHKNNHYGQQTRLNDYGDMSNNVHHPFYYNY